jgi:hypothetical protein
MPTDDQKIASASTQTGEILTWTTKTPGTLRASGGPRRIVLQHHEDGGTRAILCEAPSGAEVRSVPGIVEARTSKGEVFVRSGKEIIRYDPDLQPVARVAPSMEIWSLCVSGDEKALIVLGSNGAPGKAERRFARIYEAATLKHLRTLDGAKLHPSLYGALQERDRWAVVTAADSDPPVVALFDSRGNCTATHSFEWRWAADERIGTCYLLQPNQILAVEVGSGHTRRIPFTWRKPLPTRYLPQTPGSDRRTFLDVSDLRLTPDGRTLVLIERLNGDPHG